MIPTFTVVKVESYHQPLKAITRKPLNDATMRLQHMLLQLQKYSLHVTYKKGKYMHLADALSRAYLLDEVTVAEVKELESVSHTELLALAPEDLERLKLVASQDVAMQELRHIVLEGWPPQKADVPDAVRPYFEFQDQMTAQSKLVFKGEVVVIPAALRAEIMAKCHAMHIETEGCLRRTRSHFIGRACHPTSRITYQDVTCVWLTEIPLRRKPSCNMKSWPDHGQRWTPTCANLGGRHSWSSVTTLVASLR